VKYLLVTAIVMGAALHASRAATPEEVRDAIVAGDLTAVADALDAGFDPDASFQPFQTPAVAMAAVRGEHEILRLLLSRGASPNAIGFGQLNALSMAVRSCRASIEDITALLGAGADMENAGIDGVTPLMVAILSGRRDIAGLLLAKGARLDRVNLYGDGVLNIAIYAKEPAFVRASLSGGAPLDQLKVLFETRGYEDYEADSMQVLAKCQ
jgi:uncharacterized protein